MGYFLTPYDDIHPIFGNVPTLTTSILSTAALWAQGFAGRRTPAASTIASANSIRYDSPNMAGFTGSFQYGAAGHRLRATPGATSKTPTANSASILQRERPVQQRPDLAGCRLRTGNNGPFAGVGSS